MSDRNINYETEVPESENVSEDGAEYTIEEETPLDEGKTETQELEVDKNDVNEVSGLTLIEADTSLKEDNEYGEEDKDVHPEIPPEIGPIGPGDGVMPDGPTFDFEGDEGEFEYYEAETEQSGLDRENLINMFAEVYRRRRHAVARTAFVNRKICEYYRRQQNEAVFSPDNPILYKENVQRFRNLLLEMDRLLASKKQNEIDIKTQVAPLKQTIEDTKQMYTDHCATFEKLFRDTALTLQASASGKEIKETTVQHIIKRMANVRHHINVERFEYMETQNMVDEIEHKAKILEKLGGGLRMVDFEQLRAETQSLSDKIEERNNELEKLRLRCNADTQILAHVREKDFMLNKMILNQREILKETRDEVDYQRERCNHLRIERDTYRKKHRDLSFDCGILDKPLLLRDYDVTVDAIEKKKKEIAKLQAENEEIEKAVREIAIILSEGELIKTDSQKFEEELLREVSFMNAPIFPRIKKRNVIA